MPFDGEDLPFHVQVKIKVLDVLTKARALLSDPARWAKGGLASPVPHGRCMTANIDPRSDLAQSFCMIGSIERVVGEMGAGYSVRERSVEALSDTIRHGDVAEYNDNKNRKHPEVLAKFDAAIANVEKEIAKG